MTHSDLRRDAPFIGLLFALALIIRWPFFFSTSIGVDESTFIIMGQSILDGDLPYLALWDIKPPLAFAANALFIAVFGKSLVGIRFAGVILVWLTAYFCFRIAANIWSRPVGVFGGIIFVLSSVAIPGSQATMTETIAIVPLAAALYTMTCKESAPMTLAATGALLATATLIRFNLAYVVVGVGLYILILLPALSLKQRILNAVAFGVGGLLVTLLTVVPYLVEGHFSVWLRSVILASLSFAEARMSPIDVSLDLARQMTLLTWAPLWIFGVAGLCAALWKWQLMDAQAKRSLGVFLIFAGATFVSVIMTGVARKHYLIQIEPFAAVLAALALSELLKTRVSHVTAFLAIVIAAFMISPAYGEYRALWARLSTGDELLYGTVAEVADFLQEENPQRRPVYLMVDHLAYWLTDTRPLTRASTHPSNIAKAELLPYIEDGMPTPLSELERIFEREPLFIVTTDDI